MHTSIHTYIHALIHTYIHAWIHNAYIYARIHTLTHEYIIHTYMHAYIHTFTHEYIIHTYSYFHAYIHTRTHAYIHTYMLAYIKHTYIHTHIHTYDILLHADTSFWMKNIFNSVQERLLLCSEMAVKVYEHQTSADLTPQTCSVRYVTRRLSNCMLANRNLIIRETRVGWTASWKLCVE